MDGGSIIQPASKLLNRAKLHMIFLLLVISIKIHEQVEVNMLVHHEVLDPGTQHVTDLVTQLSAVVLHSGAI
jgi:hypothetical protein